MLKNNFNSGKYDTIVTHSSSQPVCRFPFGSQMALSLGFPKKISENTRYLHYNPYSSNITVMK